MDTDRLVYIIAANPNRDIEAEDALTRALARCGGDGLTACNPDAGACPKPCLRHRRVNVGIWPNWRVKQYRRWDFESENCPARHEYEHDRCQDFGAHLDREARKLRIASYVQNMAKQGWAYEPHETPPIFWSNGPSGETVDLVTVFNHQAEGLLRQARNITQNIGVSPMWDRESSEILIEPEPMKWTISSSVPLPFEGRTYRFDPISITVPLPDESPQPSASHQSLPAASPQLPSPDSEA